MSTEVGALHYDLSIDDHDLDKQLDQSDKKIKGFGERVSAAGEKISAGLRTASKGLAVLSVGLTAYAKNATDFTKDFVGSSKTLARTIGVTTTEASRLTAAFGRMGLEAEETTQLFGIFSKQIVAARDSTDKTTNAFSKLGVKLLDAKGNQRDFNSILFDVADKFKTLPNGIDKTALSMELFGRSGKDMIKVLNLGSEGIKELEAQADKLGLTLTADTVEKIAKLVKSQKDLKLQTDALKIAVGTLTAPVLTKFNETINKIVSSLVATNSPFKQATANVLAFGGPVAGAASTVTGFLGNISNITPKIGGFIAKMGIVGAIIAVVGGAIYLIVKHFGGLKKVFAEIQPILDIFKPSLEALANAFKQNLLPALKDLWAQVAPILIPTLKVLGALIGLGLIAAIYLVINALRILADIIAVVSHANAVLIQWIENVVVFLYRINAAVFGPVIDAFKAVNMWVMNLVMAFIGFGAKIGEAFKGIVGVIVTPFKIAFDTIAKFWNDTVGQLSFKAPSWVPGIGGKGFAMPKLPILDTGALVTKPTLAMLAVNSKPEVVIPLDKLNSTKGNTFTGDFVFNDRGAVQEFFGRLDRNQQRVSMGISQS